MGLDVAEVMMKLEDEFGIPIADHEVVAFFSTWGSDPLLDSLKG